MDLLFEVVAIRLASCCPVPAALGCARLSGHDIPHPIGDPDEDEGLPGDDDDEEEDEDEDDEEPLQVRHSEADLFALQHNFGFSAIIRTLRRSANDFAIRLQGCPPQMNTEGNRIIGF